MDFRTLQYFVVVAEELNFTRAAEKLNMSQPPLSNQIKGLEDDLGVQLFIRGKRHLKLTEEGTLFLNRARQIMELADKTRADLVTLGNELSGLIDFSMVEGRAPYLTARWIAGFRDEYPLVHYRLWNGSTDEAVERLQKGLSDLAVIAKPYDAEHLEGITVGRGPWVAIIPAKHPLAALSENEIPLKQLAGEPLILPSRASRVESIRRWFEEIGEEPDVVAETANYMDAVALVEQGAGISIFPNTTYTPNPMIVTKVITEPMRAVEYVLVWNKERKPSVLIRNFIDFVRDFMEDDRIHSERFHVKAGEFVIPEDTPLL